MTDINPAAVNAREQARLDDGKFGEQHHTAPEAQLDTERSLASTLDLLQYEYGTDAALLDGKVRDARIEAFVAEAREIAPNATAAQFSWDHDIDGSRLTFDYYLDEHGNAVEPDDDDGYPDVFDFAFDDYKEAAMFGFEDQGEDGAAVLSFDTVTVRDEAVARADYAASQVLRNSKRELETKALMRAALAAGADPERVAQFTDEDAAQLLALFERAAGEAAAHFNRD